METFAAVMAAYDPGLREHADRVCSTAMTLARRLGWSDEAVETVRLGSALHDVGKVNLRPEVLNKPAALDHPETAHVRAHPVEGIWLIAGVGSLRTALPYVLFHHERWDGTGYPTRRSGLEIPVEGRLLAVADAFDAMTSLRPYRPALSVDAAIAEVRRCAGTQFDPDIAEAFLGAVAAGEIAPATALAAAS